MIGQHDSYWELMMPGEYAMQLVYDEVIDFLTSSPTPQEIIDYRPSAEKAARVSDLIRREKTERLSADETEELDHYLEIEHIMRLAKARAHQRLAGG